MKEITINNTTYSSDFTIEEIAEHSGKDVAEIEAIILSNKKAEAEVAINKTAAAYQEKIVPNELKEEYKRKEVAARNYLAGVASEAERALLKIEADQYGISIDEHVAAILAQIEQLDSIWSLIINIRTKGKLAVRSASSINEIEQILTNLKTEASQVFVSLGI